MKNTFEKRRHAASFAVLAVYTIFAVCILCVLLSGAGVYRRLVQQGEEAYARRTCAQYVSTKVRRSVGGDSISTERFGAVQALLLYEQIDGETYVTRVYCYDGWLMELFSMSEGDFSPEDGERLVQAMAMELQLEDGLLSVRIVDAFGGESCLKFALRSGEEVRE
ncbi:MAG: DUF4860 domain-containing protein [Oscillibacter sp.]|nr:DUF4860 domain-containing protein [Oscillibacter sp.]MBQ2996426.1 DUF4860 domain-containing protein [Oscillibacter sp.]